MPLSPFIPLAQRFEGRLSNSISRSQAGISATIAQPIATMVLGIVLVAVWIATPDTPTLEVLRRMSVQRTPSLRGVLVVDVLIEG